MDCLFCKIIKKEIPAKIVFEDDQSLAFRDINPQSPTHILVIPKKHFLNISEMSEQDTSLVGHLHLVMKELAQKEGLTDFRIVTNNGAGVGQSVWHLHFHLMGGRAFGWPPG